MVDLGEARLVVPDHVDLCGCPDRAGRDAGSEGYPMTGRWWAKWSILALTLAWLAWELIANFDTNPGTWPLTWLIRHYVSPWIYFPAAIGLAVWLVFHFRPSNDRI